MGKEDPLNNKARRVFDSTCSVGSMLWLGITESVSAWLRTKPTDSSDRLVVRAAHAVAALYENGVSKTGNSRAGTSTGHVRSSLLTRGYTGRILKVRLPSSKESSGAALADGRVTQSASGSDSASDSDPDSETSRIRYSTPG